MPIEAVIVKIDTTHPEGPQVRAIWRDIDIIMPLSDADHQEAAQRAVWVINRLVAGAASRHLIDARRAIQHQLEHAFPKGSAEWRLARQTYNEMCHLQGVIDNNLRQQIRLPHRLIVDGEEIEID